VLYLRGISAGDFQEALAALLGKDAPNLSPSVISRLTAEWKREYDRWQARDLSARRYGYIWADGVYLQARMEDNAECMLVLIGATPEGKKELVGFQARRAGKRATLAGVARLSEAARIEDRAGNCRRRWRARLLEGARRDLPRHETSTLLGAQDRQRLEQGRPFRATRHEEGPARGLAFAEPRPRRRSTSSLKNTARNTPRRSNV
jgi:transposase-like protein